MPQVALFIHSQGNLNAACDRWREKLGYGIDTSRCTWSFDTCPFMIFTSCVPQISRIRSRTLAASPPTNTGFWYFVVHTRCRWISYTVCAPRRYSAIPQAYLAALELKPSPKSEGLTPPRLGLSTTQTLRTSSD
jgi:hypothetical protein